MTDLECPLCEEKVYSDIGMGCKMCGMPLQEFDVDFCSEKCEENFKEINK